MIAWIIVVGVFALVMYGAIRQAKKRENGKTSGCPQICGG